MYSKHLLLTSLPLLSEKYENKIKGFVSWMLEKHILQERSISTWLEIPSKVLKERLGYKYPSIIREILDKDIIEIYKEDTKDEETRTSIGDGYYSHKLGQCKKYRIKLNLMDKIYSTTTDNKEIIKIMTGKQRHKPNGKQYTFLWDCLKRVQLSSDYKEIVYETSEKRAVETYKDEGLAIYDTTYLKTMGNLLQVRRIRDNDLYFYTDDFAGRLYTNISQLPKYLIPVLRVNGRSLVGLDLSCCHLVMLYWMISSDYPGTLFNTNLNYSIQPTPPSLSSIVWQDRKIVQSYQTLKLRHTLSSGVVYHEMIEMFPNLSQAKAKQLLHVVINQRWEAKHEGWQYFKENYPDILQFVEGIKSKDHRVISYILQKLEVHLMYETIIPFIIKNNPNIFLATKHDCILTTEDSLDCIIEGYEYAKDKYDLPLTWKKE